MSSESVGQLFTTIINLLMNSRFEMDLYSVGVHVSRLNLLKSDSITAVLIVLR